MPVPFPVDEEHVAKAGCDLGRRLPAELRQRLLRDNGGDVTATPIREDKESDLDLFWGLHPICDGSDRRRAGRTASRIQ